ncbi:putative membrane protein [Vibrio phage 120E34-1]|nr:putative membrane protein [Vibrio phage 466E53-1]CAH9016500.1 putative membrane protein [Vibrio phage 120E34-1]
MFNFFGIAIPVWIIAAWITHVIVCFKAGTWGFLIAGAIFFPVAWAHGTWSWF